MMRAAWPRCAAAALPFMPMAALAADRVAVPIEAPEPAKPAESAKPAEQTTSVPESLRRLGIESWWDVVGFAPWDASLGLSADLNTQHLTGPDGTKQRYGSTLFLEGIEFHNGSIYVLHPAFFRTSVSLGFLAEQEKTQSGDEHTSQTSHLVNYALDGTFFPESAYNVDLSAARNQSTYVLPSGTTTESQFETRSISFHMRDNNFLREREWLPYFTTNLRFSQQDDKQVTRTAGQTYRQDDHRDAAIFDFQNGGENSDLNFQYQYNRLDNRAYETGSYSSNSANLVYSIDFGPTLNRRWDSRVNYYSRNGRTVDSNLKTLDVNEFVTIDHSVERSSYYNYQLTRQDTPLGNVTTQSGSVQAYQQVYNNLSATGNVSGIRTSLPDGSISSLGAAGNASYNHPLPWQGNVTLGVGGGYAETKSHVANGLVQVTDAVYTVPQNVGAGAAIELKDRNILTSSLVVVVIKGGARVPAVLDVDYTIRLDGDRTSLVPNPLSVVMLPGDTLNVSYGFGVSSDAKYATSSASGSVALDWRWIGASYSHDQTDQWPLSGTDSSFLLDEHRDNVSLWLFGSWDALTARADANAVRYESTRLAYTERRFDQYVSWLPSPFMQVNFSANEYRTQYELPAHVTTGGTIRLDLQWTQGAWLTTGFVSRRVFRDTLQPHETVDEAGARMRRTWTKLDLNFVVGAQKRERGGASSLNGYFHLGIVRRF